MRANLLRMNSALTLLVVMWAPMPAAGQSGPPANLQSVDVRRLTIDEAVRIALRIAKGLDHVGTMAVECFVTRDGRVLVNEVAPRVHNSGHFTLGAASTSQFEQHLRAVQPGGERRRSGDLCRHVGRAEPLDRRWPFLVGDGPDRRRPDGGRPSG